MNENEDHKEPEKGATFDMYHFFSRKDVILVIAVILAFIAFVLFKLFAGPNAA